MTTDVSSGPLSLVSRHLQIISHPALVRPLAPGPVLTSGVEGAGLTARLPGCLV